MFSSEDKINTEGTVYDPYYGPAVERQYLTGLPLYDGTVNH